MTEAALQLIREVKLHLAVSGFHAEHHTLQDLVNIEQQAMNGSDAALRTWSQRVYTNVELLDALKTSSQYLDYHVGQIAFGSVFQRARALVLARLAAGSFAPFVRLSRERIWIPDHSLITLSSPLRLFIDGRSYRGDQDADIKDTLWQKPAGIYGFWLAFVGSVSAGNGQRGWLTNTVGFGWMRATGFPQHSPFGQALLRALRQSGQANTVAVTSLKDTPPDARLTLGDHVGSGVTPCNLSKPVTGIASSIDLHRSIQNQTDNFGRAILAHYRPFGTHAEAFQSLIRAQMMRFLHQGTTEMLTFSDGSILKVSLHTSTLFVLWQKERLWMSGSSLTALMTINQLMPPCPYYLGDGGYHVNHYHALMRSGFAPLIEELFPERGRFPDIPPSEKIPPVYLRTFAWLALPADWIAVHPDLDRCREDPWTRSPVADYTSAEYTDIPATSELDHQWTPDRLQEGS